MNFAICYSRKASELLGFFFPGTLHSLLIIYIKFAVPQIWSLLEYKLSGGQKSGQWMSVFMAWPGSTLGSESTEPSQTARHRRYFLDPPPTQGSHPWVCPNASHRTLLPLPSCLRSFPQPPWARLREMIKTSKALPHCRSKLKADGWEPDPAQTSSVSPQP